MSLLSRLPLCYFLSIFPYTPSIAMKDIIRDSSLEQFLRFVTGNKFFKYHDETSHFTCPRCYKRRPFKMRNEKLLIQTHLQHQLPIKWTRFIHSKWNRVVMSKNHCQAQPQLLRLATKRSKDAVQQVALVYGKYPLMPKFKELTRSKSRLNAISAARLFL